MGILEFVVWILPHFYHWNTSQSRHKIKFRYFFSLLFCYIDGHFVTCTFDLCKLFIAFQLFAFLLKWSVRLRFHFGFSFVHAVVRIFPVIDIFWVLGKIIGWRKRECLFLWFFFFFYRRFKMNKNVCKLFCCVFCWNWCYLGWILYISSQGLRKYK